MWAAFLIAVAAAAAATYWSLPALKGVLIALQHHHKAEEARPVAPPRD
ncbi:MAG: hypothetical protein AAGC56_12730 [Pseudomonadota bacterium]